MTQLTVNTICILENIRSGEHIFWHLEVLIATGGYETIKLHDLLFLQWVGVGLMESSEHSSGTKGEGLPKSSKC